MTGRRVALAAALVALLAPSLAPAHTVHSAAKKKHPCAFKLARNSAHHDRVKISMTCHKKFVTNVRFTVKKHTVTGFTGFPGAICSVQSQHVAGCVFGGNGAPNGKTVQSVIDVGPPAPPHDSQFANVVVFISGGHDYFEVLGY
jgi:hypothetical protein